MKFEEVLPFLREGKKITRWLNPAVYIFYRKDIFPDIFKCTDGKIESWTPWASDLMAPDWRIYEIETEEQLKKAKQEFDEFTNNINKRLLNENNYL